MGYEKHNPSPDEIAAACAEIRARWSERECIRRSAMTGSELDDREDVDEPMAGDYFERRNAV